MERGGGCGGAGGGGGGAVGRSWLVTPHCVGVNNNRMPDCPICQPAQGPPIFYSVHIVQCTVYTLQCTVYSAQYKVYSVQCTLLSTQCTVQCVRFIVYNFP